MPRKNLLSLAGKALIAYTIEAGQRASGIDRLIVSTDDEEIATVAKGCGVDVPFLRPSVLASDETAIYPVLAHAVQWLQQHECWLAAHVLLLQPTSPLRTADDIEAALRLFHQRQADGVVSVTPMVHHPAFAKRIDRDGRLSSDRVTKPIHRRQEAPPLYVPNGAIYVGKTKMVIEHHTFYTNRTYAYVMPPERSLDIDTAWDFHLAELVLEERVRHGRR